MNEKKSKKLRKEMRKFFGDPSTEVRKYQVMNRRKIPLFDEKGNIVYEDRKDEKLFKDIRIMKTQVVDGTIKATGLRRLYQDTKVTVKTEGL